jgi:hypothetical protein
MSSDCAGTSYKAVNSYLRRIVSLFATMGLPYVAAAQGWSALPDKGFILGRAATDKDVADGNAIFVAKSNGIIIGKPIAMMIPQYAYLLDGKDKRRPVIVIQAEDANGIKLFGVRDLNGKEYVTKETDLHLLGSEAPD